MNRRLLLVAVLIGCLHVAIAGWFCFNGLLNADEAFYGLAAREVSAGKLPYRDFGFTQTPLVPYAQGAVMRVIGFGFLPQRVAAGLWTALALALGARWLTRRVGPGAALWFCALLSLSAGWMYNTHLGKTYAVTGAVVLGLALLVLSDLRPGARRLLGALLGAIAIGCRLPAAPFVAVLWLGWWLEPPSWRERGLTLALCVGSLAAVFAPFIAADAENFRFWTLDFHRQSVGLRNFRVVPAELWTLAPPAWLLGIAVVAAAGARRVAVNRKEAWLAAALLAVLLANLGPRGGYAEYAAPFVPALLLLIVVVGARMPRSTANAFAGAAAAIAIASAWLLPPPTDPDIYAQIRAAARAVERVAPHGAELGGPATLLALETGRPVAPRLLMTPFSLAATTDEAWAAAHHLATARWLTQRMSDATLPVYALTTQRRWNFGRTMPDFQFTNPELLQTWARQLEHDYTMAFANGAFVIFARREGPPAPAAASR